MAKMKTVIKWSIIVLIGLIISIFSFGYWFLNLLPPPVITKEELRQTLPSDLPYLTENQIPYRGKILAVVTSAAIMGESEKSTGYELTELARAYYVFQANGFEVEVASPLGGKPPVVIDGDDMKEFDYAFLNDAEAQDKVNHSIAVQNIVSGNYEALFFVGGKGAMYDFPDNEYIQSIIKASYESGKVIGAVCHGPAALVNVRLTNGQTLLHNKTVSSFTNEEELFLTAEARDIFPFLLQDKLIEQGAIFDKGAMYLNQVSSDGKLVTGQNPWSTWEAAESIIRQIGYEPKERKITAEENTITVLKTYETDGYAKAYEVIDHFCSTNPRSIDRELLAAHSIVAAMGLNISKSLELIQLLRFSNSFI